jgi:hypothetical protein
MKLFSSLLPIFLLASSVYSSSGDPQVKTNHPWYPGELSCSNFERLFKTQAELYTRVTGRSIENDEDKALAAWYWRNLNYAHGEEGAGDYWDMGFRKGGDSRTREYWKGLFADGFGLCGTTHSQWTVELQALLGNGRARGVGVTGHNSFEVYLTGGPYGKGQWALFDHDVSTVIFSPDGSRLLSIEEVKKDLNTLKNPNFKPERQRGWRVAGLADEDCATYSEFNCAEYMPGYAGPTPMLHLRAGESVRRYLQPGLEDGKTFVFWGMNYKAKGIPGLERSRSWVNQPDKMFGSKKGTGWVPGQVRYANAAYLYKPDFKAGTYKQGVISEDADQVTFEFYTPYVIGCTPSNDSAWGIYEPGGKNGLVINGKAACKVSVSTDQGKVWSESAIAQNGLDLTDLVKGHQQYWLRFHAGAPALADSELTIRTVCQTNKALIPHLKDGENKITFLSSGLGLISAGPNKDQAEAHIVDGKLGSKTVTMELTTPRKEKAVRLYAASWQSSGSPPGPAKFHIEYSTDAGKTWSTVVKDWQIVRHPPEPKDFWSQSMCWGNVALPDIDGPVRVRFSNDSGKSYQKVEAHLAYKIQQPGATDVTFAWKESGGELKTAAHSYPAGAAQEDSSWTVNTGAKTETIWVEYASK